MSASAFVRWRARCGSMEVSEALEKHLEDENRKLRQIIIVPMSGQPEVRISNLCNSARARVEPKPRESIEELIQAFTAAAFEAEEALRLAEQEWGRDDSRLVAILCLVAECVREVRYGAHDEKPLPYLSRAIDIAESMATRDLHQLANLYRQSGLALRTAGHLESAVERLEAAAHLFEQVGSAEDLSFCLGALGGSLTELRPNDALAAYRRYAGLEERLDPRGTCHYAALRGLGRCLLLLRNGVEAYKALSKAKEILLDRAQGRPHPWISELDAQLAEAQALTDGAK